MWDESEAHHKMIIKILSLIDQLNSTYQAMGQKSWGLCHTTHWDMWDSEHSSDRVGCCSYNNSHQLFHQVYRSQWHRLVSCCCYCWCHIMALRINLDWDACRPCFLYLFVSVSHAHYDFCSFLLCWGDNNKFLVDRKSFFFLFSDCK